MGEVRVRGSMHVSVSWGEEWPPGGRGTRGSVLVRYKGARKCAKSSPTVLRGGREELSPERQVTEYSMWVKVPFRRCDHGKVPESSLRSGPRAREVVPVRMRV